MTPQLQIRVKTLLIRHLVNIPVIPGLGDTIKQYIIISKTVNCKTLLKIITILRKILKLMPKAYGVGLTRRDTLDFLLIIFCSFFQSLDFGELFHAGFLPFAKLNTEKTKHLLQQKRKGKVVVLDYSLTVHSQKKSWNPQWKKYAKLRGRLGKFVNLLFDTSFLYHYSTV